MRWLLPGLVYLISAINAWSQPVIPPTTIRVGFAGSPPFIMKGGAEALASGFSPDLWNDVVAANGWNCSYRLYGSTAEALDAIRAKECDVLVGNTSITSDREKLVEFSQPFYRSGLQIMVSENRGQMVRWAEQLFVPQHLAVLGFVVFGVLIATLAIAAFERRHNPDFPKTGPAGLAEAFYYVMGLITGKSSYKGFPGVLGRLVLVGWMLASLFVVSYVTSVITSSMTADILQGHIHGPQDLPDKMIGLIAGTQSEDYARAHNLDYAAYKTLDDAVADLVKGKVQCLIGDSPVFQYYDYTHPRVPIHEVGAVFQPVNYGFAMPVNSPLRGPINFVLLHLNESGYFDELGQKYFGASYQK